MISMLNLPDALASHTPLGERPCAWSAAAQGVVVLPLVLQG
jgi:hypothetical protein